MKKNRVFAIAAGVASYALVISLIVFLLTMGKSKKKEPSEEYNELEFVVVHRPQLTYFVDMKYFLCFATRKPDYQDLVQFSCPERMLKDVENSLQRDAIK